MTGFSRVQTRKLTDSVAGNYTPLLGVTPGVAANKKALVLDGSGAIGTITSLTATTLTATTLNAGTIGTAGINATQTYRLATQVDATSTTLADLTGLAATVVVGTYSFRAHLRTTCGGTGGVKLAFNYTTAVLSAIDASAYATTASAIATSTTTTTTTQTSIVASNTAFTGVIIEGTMVVTTGGTVTLQFAENSANSTSSVLVGSTFEMTRIA